jgi:hypothetical protein
VVAVDEDGNKAMCKNVMTVIFQEKQSKIKFIDLQLQ